MWPEDAPVYWTIIHQMGLAVETVSQLRDMDAAMRMIALSFPCQKCRPHFDAFVASRPFDGIEPHRAFEVTWRFHNSVNQRTGRPTVGWEDALAHYAGGHCNVAACQPPAPDYYTLVDL